MGQLVRNLTHLFIISIFFILPLSAWGSAEVFFNQDPRVSYMDPYRNIERPGHNFEEMIVDFIKGARESVEVAVQEFRLSSIARALVEKHKRGIEVRVIIDDSYNTLLPTKALDELGPHWVSEKAIDILKQEGIPVYDDTSDGSSGTGLMHHKFIVVDKKKTLITSSNFTLRDIHGAPNSRLSLGNANALLTVNNPELASIFLKEFNIMYGAESVQASDRKPQFGQRKPYRGAQPVALNQSQFEVQFSPTSRSRPHEENTSGLIVRHLKKAKESMRLALFVFSDQNIADTIKSVKRRTQMRLSVLIERMFAFRDYSKAMDLLGLKLLSPSCQYPANANPWDPPAEFVGVPQTWGTDKLHHKFAVIDGETVIFGSKNWTQSGIFNNDETLMVIRDPDIAREFNRELDRLESDAHWGPLPWVLDRIKEREEMCADQLAS